MKFIIQLTKMTDNGIFWFKIATYYRKNDDCKAAMKCCEFAVQSGHVKSMYNLGLMADNYEEKTKYLEMAAQHGDNFS